MATTVLAATGRRIWDNRAMPGEAHLPPVPPAITDGGWVVLELNGTPAVAGHPPRFSFDGEGRVAGTTGLNRFFGPYSYEDSLLTVRMLATTRMAGEPELMEQEQRFLLAFAGEFQVRSDGDHLLIERPGAWLSLAPATPD
jgi:heat shock protein HslJ